MEPTKGERVCIKFCGNQGKSATETLPMISMSRTHKSKLAETEEGERGVKSKVKGMLIIFSGIKGIVHKEFVLAGHAVNSPYCCDFYGDCVKMCEDIAPNSDDKRTGYRITTLPFSPGSF
jgi:hypothetical protein